MSSSNRFLLSTVCLTISCVGVERAEIAREEPVQHPLEASPAELSQIAKELDEREAYLEDRRDGAEAIATAVLYDAAKRELPALGMAEVEVNAGGLGISIAANLGQGTHRIYLLDKVMDCSSVDLEKQHLIGSPRTGRAEYLGALVNVRDGSARFERHLPEGVPEYGRVFGRPLVLVHAKGASTVCGVFQEYEPAAPEAITVR